MEAYDGDSGGSAITEELDLDPHSVKCSIVTAACCVEILACYHFMHYFRKYSHLFVDLVGVLASWCAVIGAFCTIVWYCIPRLDCHVEIFIVLAMYSAANVLMFAYLLLKSLTIKVYPTETSDVTRRGNHIPVPLIALFAVLIVAHACGNVWYFVLAEPFRLPQGQCTNRLPRDALIFRQCSLTALNVLTTISFAIPLIRLMESKHTRDDLWSRNRKYAAILQKAVLAACVCLVSTTTTTVMIVSDRAGPYATALFYVQTAVITYSATYASSGIPLQDRRRKPCGRTSSYGSPISSYSPHFFSDKANSSSIRWSSFPPFSASILADLFREGGRGPWPEQGRLRDPQIPVESMKRAPSHHMERPASLQTFSQDVPDPTAVAVAAAVEARGGPPHPERPPSLPMSGGIFRSSSIMHPQSSTRHLDLARTNTTSSC